MVRRMIREPSLPGEKPVPAAAGLRLSAGFPPAFRHRLERWRKAVSSDNMTIPRSCYALESQNSQRLGISGSPRAPCQTRTTATA